MVFQLIVLLVVSMRIACIIDSDSNDNDNNDADDEAHI